MDRLRIITSGLIAQYPLGGVTWDYLQFVLGLARLGHDVYYIEDTDQWPYNPEEDGVSKTCGYNLAYLSGIMERFGFGDRWAYRFPWEGQWFGLPENRRTEVVRTADLLINVSGTLGRPEEYRHVPRMAYIDTDPVFTQVKLARGQQDFRRVVDLHDVLFSFGECLPTSAVPDTGHRWNPTRQPILLDAWSDGAGVRRNVFTTVMNWTSYNPLDFNGQTYGQKDVEFRRFLDLPSRVSPTALELAINSGKTRHTPRDLLARRGWRLVDPIVDCGNLDSYRRYIQTSTAEWSVAKNGYVVGQSGWFSCRSACYLAAGRPVVVQDSGYSSVLPVGEGIVPFSTVEQAIDGIRSVEENYDRHSRAAAEIARNWFDSDAVLTDLIETALASSAPAAEELTR